MSLQVNLSNRDIFTAYQDVVNANGINWAIFTYEKGSNDLKVQNTGDGGLEELEDEFSDGRMQYAFVRVTDPNSQLPKFVQINWCGDGVPVSRKGLFHTHSSAVAAFLKGTHVVVNARNESDVSPSLIMSRVEAASGAKYSTHKETARKFEPIAPVGTNYTPVGKVDIGALRRDATAKPTPSPVARPTPPSTSRPVAPPVVKSAPAPDDEWDPTPARSPPLPMSTRPSTTPSVSRPPPSPVYKGPAPVVSSTVSSKPAEEDRIGPVGTNYTPVSLPRPKKLVNPFEKKTQEQQTQAATQPVKRSGGMTWSERQALSKKRVEEEEAQSKAASAQIPTSTSTTKWKASSGIALGASATVAVGAVATISSHHNEELQDGEDWEAPAPLAPPPAASRPVIPEPEPDYDLEPEPEPAAALPPPPPPPPPPPLAPVPQMQALNIQELEPEPTPLPVPTGAAHGQGVCAVVTYPYEAAEENEIDLIEGELIEQIEQVDEGWWSGVGDSGRKTGLFPANYVEIVEQPEVEAKVPPPPPPPPPPPAAPAAPTAPPRAPTPEPAVDLGVTAIALYDYEAAEDNEISFQEGDRIVAIEAASDDWWQGTSVNGHIGLFPANYVQIEE